MTSILDLLRPSSPNPQPVGLAKLLADAQRMYPFIAQYNPVLTGGQGNGDYAETWRPGDPGDSTRPRPSAIPLNRVGVEVYRPNEFGPTDLAAEFLHVDPVAAMMRQRLMASLSPSQAAELKHAAGDYQDTLRLGGSERDAMRNSMDSAMRGYTVGQWPAEANAAMRYTPQQAGLLETLKRYMQSGHQ